MFTFDTPFKGAITQNRHHNKIIIKLQNSSIESPKIKNIASSYVSKLTIAPIENEVQIIAKTASNVGMKASKTSDGYGLRLRFMAEAAPAQKNNSTAPDLSNLPTKPETEISMSYMIVIALLLLSIIVLLIFKKRLGSKKTVKKEKKPSIFGKGENKPNDVNIRFQKSIDTNNKVVMLEYANESYLVVIGASNLLLDKFDANEVRTQNEFDEMLDSKHQELDQFLKIKKESAPNQEAFESYKDKASGFDVDEIELQND
jgi:hypothetical protein